MISLMSLRRQLVARTFKENKANAISHGCDMLCSQLVGIRVCLYV